MLRKASEEGEEDVCVCLTAMTVLMPFVILALPESEVVDGPWPWSMGLNISSIARAALAAGGGVSVFVIPWSAVFVMAVGHVEFIVVLFSGGALDLL